MAAFSLLGFENWRAAFAPVFLHLLVWGWISAMIFGVAFWMFPVHARGNPRNRQGSGWLSFWFFLSGLVLRTLCEPFLFLFPDSAVSRLGLLLAAASLWLSALAFTFCIWTRIKGKER